MNVLILVRSLVVGGSIINALNLGTALQNRGHKVFLTSDSGPLVEQLSERGLHHLLFPYIQHREPSLATVQILRRFVLEQDIDVIHSFESIVPRVIDVYSAGLLTNCPVLISHMGNWLPPFYYPRIGPVTIAVPDLVDLASTQKWMTGHLEFWSARIRTDEYCSDDAVHEFQRQHGLDDSMFKLVTINRMEPVMNEHYLKFVIQSCAQLWQNGTHDNIKLVLVGDGPSRVILEQAAREVEKRVGPGRFIFTGEMPDAIPAYRSADIILGRSSSLLRAMALGLPSIMIGENFSRLVEPATHDELEYLHYYFNAPDDPDAKHTLAQHILTYYHDPTRRVASGQFGRQVIAEKHAIELGAAQIEELYERLRAPGGYPSRAVQACEILRAWWSVMRYRVRRRVFGTQLEGAKTQ